MTETIEWWGVISAANFKDPAPRLAELWERAQSAPDVHSHAAGDDGSFVVRWRAPQDKNAALRVLHEAIRADAMDFDPARRPEPV